MIGGNGLKTSFRALSSSIPLIPECAIRCHGDRLAVDSESNNSLLDFVRRPVDQSVGSPKRRSPTDAPEDS